MFTIGLPDDLLPKLNKQQWWRELLAYRYQGAPLFIGLRDDYISVYVNGRAIYKEIYLTNGSIKAKFDRRYFYGPTAERGDMLFDGNVLIDEISRMTVDNGSRTIRNLETWIKQVSEYSIANISDNTLTESKIKISEKECLAKRAARSNTINIEMALPGFRREDGKRVARRIDMVHIEERSADGQLFIIFTEAKLYRNTRSLRRDGNIPAKIIEQVLSYQRYIEENAQDIKAAYTKCCCLLIDIRNSQKSCVDSRLQKAADGAELHIETLPRVLVFEEPKHLTETSARDWQVHKDKITNSGIKLEVVQTQG